MNNEELKLKATQLENEEERLEMDRASRKNQLKMQFLDIGTNFLANFSRTLIAARYTGIAMNEEYNLNGSKNIPMNLQRKIEKIEKKF